jgi:hypothetical protein
MASRAVLTIATGKPAYVNMAANLARSFKYWHKDSAIQFALVTDQKQLLPKDLSDISIIEIEPGSYGEGFSTKLNLDVFAPAEQTLFVDADCLCVGNLEPAFERFKGRSVSVIGGTISSGEWFGDVTLVCQRFGVKALPKFNGGIYYLEKNYLVESIFNTARELEPRYDEMDLVRLRSRPNDELLIAISMAVHDQWGIPEDGTIMAEPLNFGCGIEIDVLKGAATLFNNPSHRNYQPHWPLEEAHPLVVHFLGGYTDRSPYTREAMRLQKHMGEGWPASLATLYAKVFCSAPEYLIETLKDSLRPAYRKLLGTRAIARSNRI